MLDGRSPVAKPSFERIFSSSVFTRMPSYRAMRALAVLGWIFAHISGRAEPVPPEAALSQSTARVWTRILPDATGAGGDPEDSALEAPRTPIQRDDSTAGASVGD